MVLATPGTLSILSCIISSTISPYAAIFVSLPGVFVKINQAIALSSKPEVSSVGSPASSG